MIAKLKELRQRKGISQQTLAEAIGVSQQSVNKYENHHVEPDIRTLIALADYFNTSVDYLIGHTEIEHKIEATTAYDLNKEEAALLEKWRQLGNGEKESILSVMENYISKK